MIVPFVHDGPINHRACETYVEKALVPELCSGNIVVMDNLSSRRSRRHRTPLLAALQPKAKPIWMAFAKFKALLQKAAESPQSDAPSKPSELGDAETTSPPQDMIQPVRITL